MHIKSRLGELLMIQIVVNNNPNGFAGKCSGSKTPAGM